VNKDDNIMVDWVVVQD